MIEIHEACIRDVTYVSANMRPQDARELYCQLPEGTNSTELAYLALNGAWCAYTAFLNGKPAGVFGMTAANYAETVYSAWAFGTKNFRRVTPRIGRYCLQVVAPRLVVAGARRVEVRSIHDHDLAHKWLTGLGAARECDLVDYGRNGERFTLWSFTATNWKNSDVFQHSEASEAA